MRKVHIAHLWHLSRGRFKKRLRLAHAILVRIAYSQKFPLNTRSGVFFGRDFPTRFHLHPKICISLRQVCAFVRSFVVDSVIYAWVKVQTFHNPELLKLKPKTLQYAYKLLLNSCSND